MEEEDKLPKEKLKEESFKLLAELKGLVPESSLNINTVGIIERAIKRGYELGYDKFYTPMCEKCEYRNATCFGPGAFCEECSMEEFEREELEGLDEEE